MTARAAGCASRAPSASPIRLVGRLGLAFAAVVAGCPAHAEVGAAVSVFSESRFRGHSLSGGHPVGSVDLSYDDSSGLYAAGSASVLVSSSDGIKPLGLQVSGGYAQRVSPATTVDFGLIHSRYSRYSGRAGATSYTEVYAGLTHKFLSSRIAFSPHYFGGGSTVYGEVDANFTPIRKLQLTAHAGLLVPLGYGDSNQGSSTQYDWRVGLAREVGHASFHLIATGGGPGRDYYRDRGHNRTALIAGVSWAL